MFSRAKMAMLAFLLALVALVEPVPVGARFLRVPD